MLALLLSAVLHLAPTDCCPATTVDSPRTAVVSRAFALPKTAYWPGKTGATILSRAALPVALWGAALALDAVPTRTAASLSKENLQARLRADLPTGFRTHVDDYLGALPLMAVYAAPLFGLKPAHAVGARTHLLVKALGVNTVLTLGLKDLINSPRPNGKDNYSLPSGHTSTAFAVARFADLELRHFGWGVPVSVYTVATTVGALRIANNAHWLPDVLAGAATGLLSTEIAYLTHNRPWSRWPLRRLYHPVDVWPVGGMPMP